MEFTTICLNTGSAMKNYVDNFTQRLFVCQKPALCQKTGNFWELQLKQCFIFFSEILHM